MNDAQKELFEQHVMETWNSMFRAGLIHIGTMMNFNPFDDLHTSDEVKFEKEYPDFFEKWCSGYGQHRRDLTGFFEDLALIVTFEQPFTILDQSGNEIIPDEAVEDFSNCFTNACKLHPDYAFRLSTMHEIS